MSVQLVSTYSLFTQGYLYGHAGSSKSLNLHGQKKELMVTVSSALVLELASIF
jgi:hypothetical protein